MKSGKPIIMSALLTLLAVFLLAAGYFTGNPHVVKLLGGSEIDVAFRQNAMDGDVGESPLNEGGEKNYLPPLPKYSYLSEEEANMINNPSIESADTTLVRFFPELLQKKDTLP